MLLRRICIFTVVALLLTRSRSICKVQLNINIFQFTKLNKMFFCSNFAKTCEFLQNKYITSYIAPSSCLSDKKSKSGLNKTQNWLYSNRSRVKIIPYCGSAEVRLNHFKLKPGGIY